MSLQARTLLLVTVLVLFAVAATAIPLTLRSRDSLLDQTTQEGERLAGVVAGSAAYSDRAWRDVESAIGKQMVVQAEVTAEWIAAAERAGISPEEINSRLDDVTERTALDEFWVTDADGHAYLHSVPGIDFTFRPDPKQQPQASAFYPLLTGERARVIQRAQKREVDDRIFKYAGVGGVDQPRIVQVGFEARYLAGLRRQVGLVRLVEETAQTEGVDSVRVVNRRLGTRVVRAGPEGSGEEEISEREADAVRATTETGHRPEAFEEDGVLTVAAPIHAERTDTVIGAVLIGLSTEHIRGELRNDLLLAIAIAIATLAAALAAAVIGARRVARPVGQLTAAARKVEDASYEPGSLTEVAERPDEIGTLAQVFDRMAREVRAREERMQREIKELTVQIDESKRRRQVAEVTETDYFRDLQRRAKDLRGGKGGDED